MKGNLIELRVISSSTELLEISAMLLLSAPIDSVDGPVQVKERGQRNILAVVRELGKGAKVLGFEAIRSHTRGERYSLVDVSGAKIGSFKLGQEGRSCVIIVNVSSSRLLAARLVSTLRRISLSCLSLRERNGYRTSSPYIPALDLLDAGHDVRPRISPIQSSVADDCFVDV